MPGPSLRYQIDLFQKDQLKLQTLARSLKRAHSLVVRATIILLLSLGISISEVSRQTKVSRQIIRKWAKRYCEQGVNGLADKSRKGRPPEFDAEVAMHIIKIACEVPAERGRTLDKWDCQEIAKDMDCHLL